MFSENEKIILLKAARSAIEDAIIGKTSLLIKDVPQSLREPCGAFVTLHKEGELRGCIGYVEGIKPLIETVKDVAEKAALEDYRFSPVTEDELPKIEIEISILSPLKQIKSIDEIEVGKHGLIIEQGGYRGLLLPQVAAEYGWDRTTFLNQTARKAGLSPEEWKNPKTKIFIFTAEIIKEGLK